MALVINSNPDNGYSIHDELIFVVYESVKAADPVTYPNYKYVADIYVDTVLVARQKSVPNPTTLRGEFNISGVVRNYVNQLLNPLVAVQSQTADEGEFFASVQVKFGQEYSDTLYTNVVVDSERKYYNYYKGRTTSLETLSDYADAVLSNKPLISEVRLADNYLFVPYYISNIAAFDYELKKYNASGTLLGTSTVAITPTIAKQLLIFNVAPLATGGFINSAVSYYTFQVESGSVYRFNIVCDPKYTNNKIHFLNKMGGFDTFAFDKVSRTTIDNTKKSFQQRDYEITSSGGVVYFNSNNVYNEINKVYYSSYKEMLKVNSNLLTDAEYVWLQELIVSPLVYWENDNYFYPIKINNTNYELKKIVNDRMTNLMIDFEILAGHNTQYR